MPRSTDDDRKLARQLGHFKRLRKVAGLLSFRHSVGCVRDKAHNRESPRQVGHLGRAGLDTTKKADPSAPLKGTIVVRANSDGGTTIRKIQDFYEVHYPGNDAPAGCGLAPGEKLTGGRGGSRLVCACRQHRRREPGHVLHRAQRLTGPEDVH